MPKYRSKIKKIEPVVKKKIRVKKIPMPQLKELKPIVEKIQQIQKHIEDVKPIVEKVKAVVEQVKPVVEQVKPVVEKVKDVVEKVKDKKGGDISAYLSKAHDVFSNVINSNFLKSIISNKHNLYRVLSHLSSSSYSNLILEFLKEVISQMLGNEPSNMFPDLHISKIDSSNPLFHPLKDLLKAKSISQIMNVLISEHKEEPKVGTGLGTAGALFDAVHHTLHHSLKGVHHHLEKDLKKGGKLSDTTKNLLYYGLPVVGVLSAAYGMGYDPSYLSHMADTAYKTFKYGGAPPIPSFSNIQSSDLIEIVDAPRQLKLLK